MALGRQGSRPEEGNLFHMGLGHQGRMQDSRQGGTALAVGSSEALVAGAVGLVARLDVTVPAVPVAHMMLAKDLCRS